MYGIAWGSQEIRHEVERTTQEYLRLQGIDPANEKLGYLEDVGNRGFFLRNERAGEFFERYGPGNEPLCDVLRNYWRDMREEADMLENVTSAQKS